MPTTTTPQQEVTMSPTASPVTKPSSGKPAAQKEAGYLAGVRQEWGQITWPTVPQLWTQTIVVLVFCTLLTLGIWGADQLFRWTIALITPGQ